MRMYDKVVAERGSLVSMLIAGVAFRQCNKWFMIVTHHGDHLADVRDYVITGFVADMKRQGITEDTSWRQALSNGKGHSIIGGSLTYAPESFGLTQDDQMRLMDELFEASCKEFDTARAQADEMLRKTLTGFSLEDMTT